MRPLVVDSRSGQAVQPGETVDWTLLEVRDRIWRAWVLIRSVGGRDARWVECAVRWFHPAATERGRYRVVLVPT